MCLELVTRAPITPVPRLVNDFQRCPIVVLQGQGTLAYKRSDSPQVLHRTPSVRCPRLENALCHVYDGVPVGHKVPVHEQEEVPYHVGQTMEARKAKRCLCVLLQFRFERYVQHVTMLVEHEKVDLAVNRIK